MGRVGLAAGADRTNQLKLASQFLERVAGCAPFDMRGMKLEDVATPANAVKFSVEMLWTIGNVDGSHNTPRE